MDTKIVDKFISLLRDEFRERNLLEFINISTMDDFGKSAEVVYNLNSRQIEKQDIFIIMTSPSFISSNMIVNNELPAVLKLVDENLDKEAFIVPLYKYKGDFKGKVFFEARQKFTAVNAPLVTYFDEIDMKPSEIASQQRIYVSDLVDQIIPYLEDHASESIKSLRDLTHIDDFFKHKNRTLRVCLETDSIFVALGTMSSYPPLRHLVVVNDRGDFTGILSIRDIQRFQINNHIDRENGYLRISDFAKKAVVKDIMTKREKLVCYSLDKENDIREVIQHFILSPEVDHPIGVIPVFKKEGNYQKNTFELVSYIDILREVDRFKDIRIIKSKELVDVKENRTEIIQVNLNDSVSEARFYASKGYRTIPITNDLGEFVGLLSSDDLLNVSNETLHMTIRQAKESRGLSWASKKGNFFRVSTKVSKAIDKFIENRRFTSFPILDDENKIYNMFGYTDFLKELISILGK